MQKLLGYKKNFYSGICMLSHVGRELILLYRIILLPQDKKQWFKLLQSKHTRNTWILWWCTSGLHNSESSKCQIDPHEFATSHRSLFYCGMEKILKQQLFIKIRAFATFSATEKALMGCKKRSCGLCVELVQAWSISSCCFKQGRSVLLTKKVMPVDITLSKDVKTWI